MAIRITPCGAARGVTGSCHLIEAKGLKILIDCGMFQGAEEPKNREPFPFDPKKIDFLILTHAHVDHCGRIPLLVKEGFRGKILCTRPTTQIARIMLLDSAKVMWETYKARLKKARRTGQEVEPPLYEEIDVLDSFDRFYTPYLSYKEEFHLGDGVSLVLGDAGHILGSSFVELRVNDKVVVFSVVRHLDEPPVDSYKRNVKAQVQNTPNQKLTSPL